MKPAAVAQIAQEAKPANRRLVSITNSSQLPPVNPSPNKCPLASFPIKLGVKSYWKKLLSVGSTKTI